MMFWTEKFMPSNIGMRIILTKFKTLGVQQKCSETEKRLLVKSGVNDQFLHTK